MNERADRYILEMMGRNTQHHRQFEQDFVNHVVEEEQDRDFNISLPYSDLSGVWFNTDSNLSHASSAVPLWRLSNVTQLGFLINLGAGQEFDNEFIEPFNHTRVNHSLVVGMVMGQILRRNHANENEIRVGEAVGAIHDIATPAGGDAVKALDTEHLDEENFWWEVIDKKGWDYLASIGTTREQMDEIVHNKGFLGEMLDIADRITYVMQDLGGFMDNGIWVSFDAPTLKGYNKEVQKLLSQDTALGDIYKTVFVDKESERIYFSDPEKLRKFLELRAVLHRDIYLNWASQGRDMLVRELLRPFYSTDEEEGKLTPHDLRRMGDEELIGFLAEQYGEGRWGNNRYGFRMALDKFKPNIETFPTIEEAKERRLELEQNPELIVLGVKQVRRFNPGTDYLVLNGNGDIVPFSEHDPVCSQRLHGISISTERNFVFYAKEKDIPRPIRI